MSPVLLDTLQKHFRTQVLDYHAISGGDINEAYLVSYQGKRFFVKYNASPRAYTMFRAEALGLSTLAKEGTFRTPQVHKIERLEEGAFLLMEYIESGLKTASFWETFGRSLAQLHRKEQGYFGFLADNFIGTLPQSNLPHRDWISFYIKARLEPQVVRALEQERITHDDSYTFFLLFEKLPSLCPQEPPALIHGDLWSGNFMVDSKGNPVLIDPSVAYAHRELDLAMTQLFGGFDGRFYDAYEEVYPLESDFSQRVEIYHLYYLMVHVNLFGGNYVNSVRQILRRF